VYLHNPPGEDNSLNLATAPLAPEALKDHVARLRDEDPEVNQWVCIGVLAICIGLMAATAEFVSPCYSAFLYNRKPHNTSKMVESIDFVREESGIKVEYVHTV